MIGRSNFLVFLRDSVFGENREYKKVKWSHECQLELSMIERIPTLSGDGYDSILKSGSFTAKMRWHRVFITPSMHNLHGGFFYLKEDFL